MAPSIVFCLFFFSRSAPNSKPISKKQNYLSNREKKLRTIADSIFVVPKVKVHRRPWETIFHPFNSSILL
jgi:hypothetical protein